ncbi:magnesium transporter [Desulfothermus okinawensis JCM 13304]
MTKNPLLVPEIREFISKNDVDTIKEFCSSTHPGIVAEFISPLSPNEIWDILKILNPDLRAEIFSHLDLDLQIKLTQNLSRHDLAQLISEMSPDDRVDLLKKLPEEFKENLLPAIAQAEREDIRKLSSYPEGTAGAVMTSDYATLPPDITAQQAIDKLRKEAPDKETIYYCYVVDEQRRLLGFVSLKDLILAKPDTLVKEIMNKDLIYAHVLDDQEEVARKIQKYDLIALPVVNGNDALVGIITYDDAMDIITQEHTEDMEKLMAITGEHEAAAYMKTPVIEHFKNRCGWLIFLALLGFVSGFIVQKFENVIMQFTILATFMPMLADTGGNTGSQSATLVIRALALKEITPRDFLRVIYKEFNISLLLGIALAFVAILRVYFYALTTPTYHLPLTKIGMAVGVALSLQVISSTLIGAILPLIAARFKTDPAVVASPALTTIVDITGLFIFFTTAKIILGI